ncbi:MAG: rhodanese-related sulfurtransferase [Brucellaceae bacterium]|nr:rhodanese-related sulfurtransferase [Brucellaceae bacterium]
MAGQSQQAGPFKVAALYRFTPVNEPARLRDPVHDFCVQNGIRGTLLLADEGINGTVAGTGAAIDALIAMLRAMPEFADLEVKYSTAAEMPFHRMKVRLKREIVTMGVDGIDPLETVGTYVAPGDWNALISDPETVVVDTRNSYETKLGTFRNALDPQTLTFREFPDWVKRNRNVLAGRKVAMYCTGGIRCEKATALAKSLGLDEVFHLKGGILKYLEDVPAEDSLWDGECFVFDERVSVGHGLKEGQAILCRACRTPLTPDEVADPAYEEGVSCPHCIGERSAADRARYAERQRQVDLHARRGTKPHIGG